jgi:pyridoxamine 5'-phosphate oxidase
MMLPMTDPIVRFRDAMARAATNPPYDPIAVSLATSTPDGRPSCRIVLLHEVDERGFVFHTNYGGRKGLEIEANPHAALTAYWPWTDEQIRIEGTIARVSSSESDGYFAVRPRCSQIGAWASLQSQPLDSRDALLERVRQFEQKFEGAEVPRPDHWGGYRIAPLRIEFWKAGEFRLHDREVYERVGDGWQVTRLYP